MKKYPQAWTEKDVLQLIGQAESSTLEFKASKLLAPGKKFARMLSQDISAFANAEGGTILIGISEKRSRPRIALELDEGIDPNLFSPEWLQQVVETSIRPHLRGIECQIVPLSGEREGRVAYRISVPRGDTAYQASDFVYYMRNGFTTEPMPDHLVRLLMLRGSVARAELTIGNCDIVTKNELDEYRFDLMVSNPGEITIQDFLLSVSISITDESFQMWAPTMFVDNEEAIRNELKSVESMLEIGEDIDEYKKHEMLHGPGIPFQSGDTLRCSYRRVMQLLYQIDGRKLFPKDRLVFPGGKWLIEAIPHEVPIVLYQPRLNWRIYIDNAPPCSGEIDIGEEFQQEQELLSSFF
jgi:hypothetical protein